MFKLSPYRTGVCLIALAAVILSTFGLMVRSIEAASPWELVFWRSVGAVLSVLVILVHRYGRQTFGACRAIGRTAVLGGALLGASFILFVLSVTETTVGNTLFIMGVTPFVTAILGWIFLGERVQPVTWLAMSVAFGGVGLMFLDGLFGHGLSGQVFALSLAICGAGYMVVLRRGQRSDMIMAVLLAGVFSMLAAVVPAFPLDMPWRDAAIAVGIGVLQNGIAQALIAKGARHVPATQISLLVMIEVVLGPIWVWIAVGEELTALTLAGGLLVVGTVVAQILGVSPSAGAEVALAPASADPPKA